MTSKKKDISKEKIRNKSSLKSVHIDYCKENFWEYCDNCGQKLISRKCELICLKCGFFRSCSEP